MRIRSGESATKLHRVDAKPVQHVFVDDRQLLDRVVYADGPFFQAQRPTEFPISHGRDTRRAMGAKINRHPVGLPVVQGGKHAFSGVHGDVSNAADKSAG